jgi:phospholipid/cholesterol/gamma-HCH transport system substrate-binding protein
MREERRERGLKLKVGMFILVALAAFLGMIYALGARARLFEPRYAIHAAFTEVGGLTQGATVRLAGVQIGRVTGVDLPAEPGGKVQVELTIARRFADRIRKDSIARIETQGLLGDKIVEIAGGTAATPPVAAGETIIARDPTDLGKVMNQGAETVQNVAALALSLRETAEALNQAKVVQEIAATTTSARKATDQLGRLVEQVEKGKGWAHVLLYEEPVALRRVNDLIAKTQAVLDRVERGEGAVGVLTSARSTEAAQKLVVAMERFAALTDPSSKTEGVLPALLFDPRYKSLLEDLRVTSANLRQVSDRILGGKGTLGSLVKDDGDDGGLRLAIQDLQKASANMREITAKINEGEGTLGALIGDPTVYERLVTILDGAQRSRVLRFLLRNLGDTRDGAAGTRPPQGRRE